MTKVFSIPNSHCNSVKGKTQEHKGHAWCTLWCFLFVESIMSSCCLTGLATAQTITDLTSCITKENNLKMECNFNPAASASPPPMCKFTQGNKIVGSTDRAEEQDATYRHRANVTIKASVCELYLTGLSDNAQDFKCTIKQTEMKDKTARVVRSKSFLSF